jgi:methylglyoxal synthase
MFENQYFDATIPEQKCIALIAHDNKKKELIEWCMKNKKVLEHHFLCGTGTSAKMVADQTGLPVRGYNSGPLGGDQQIGSRIVDGKIDIVIFFSDPLSAQPHDPDVKALLRIAQVYDIPIANNRSTADFLITSPYMDKEYTRKLLNFRKNVEERAKTLDVAEDKHAN